MKSAIFRSQVEFVALMLFNKVCMELKGYFPRGTKGLYEIRMQTMTMFVAAGGKCKNLLRAFKRLHPNWVIRGKDDYEKCIGHLACMMGYQGGIKCNYGERMFVTISPQRFLRDMQVPPPPPKKKEGQFLETVPKGKCQIHPHRKAYNKKRKLCASCYQKLVRLDLLNHPLNMTLLRILKRRLKHHEVLKFCVNHEDLLSEPNGLCMECNQNVGLGDEAAHARHIREETKVDAENWDELLDLVEKQKV